MAKPTDKIALITGGPSGIGLATAHLFLGEGAQVIVTGGNSESNAQTQTALGSAADVIAANTSDLDAVDTPSQTIRSRYGRLDALFVNAGVSQFAPLAQTSPDIFGRHFITNVRGGYFTIQNAVSLMTEGSAILINASTGASIGTPRASAYSASKAALRSLGRTLAAELVPCIRVNVVSPGLIDTPTYSKMGLPAEAAEALSQQLVGVVPMERFGLAQELAKTALFLLSDDSTYLTGTEVFVEGGATRIGAASAMIPSAA